MDTALEVIMSQANGEIRGQAASAGLWHSAAAWP